MTLHDKLIAAIKLQTPPGESLAGELMKLLSVSKVAAYRRLRGEIQLALDEAVVIAKHMGMSLDNLIEGGEADNYAFHITPFRVSCTLDEYYYTLRGMMMFYDFVKSDPDSCCCLVSKVLSPTFYFKYETFTKFTMFKWIYQVQNSTKYSSLSAVEVSPHFEELYEPFREVTKSVRTTYIFNEYLFAPIVADIRYFYAIKLLTSAEVETLKNDLLMIIDDLEEVATRGCYENGVRASIYITDSFFDISYSYIGGNGRESCAIGVYGLNFLSCQESRVVANQKAWIDSLLRSATSITGSGEMKRIAFFNSQRDKVRAIIV